MSQNKDTIDSNIDLGEELQKTLVIHSNVKQEIIITTADKIELVLMKAKDSLTAQRDWWTPSGLIISFVTTLCTADFKTTIGISKETWAAIFMILTLVCAIWLAWTLLKVIKTWGQGDLKTIIKEIKPKS